MYRNVKLNNGKTYSVPIPVAEQIEKTGKKQRKNSEDLFSAVESADTEKVKTLLKDFPVWSKDELKEALEEAQLGEGNAEIEKLLKEYLSKNQNKKDSKDSKEEIFFKLKDAIDNGYRTNSKTKRKNAMNRLNARRKKIDWEELHEAATKGEVEKVKKYLKDYGPYSQYDLERIARDAEKMGENEITDLLWDEIDRIENEDSISDSKKRRNAMNRLNARRWNSWDSSLDQELIDAARAGDETRVHEILKKPGIVPENVIQRAGTWAEKNGFRKIAAMIHSKHFMPSDYDDEEYRSLTDSKKRRNAMNRLNARRRLNQEEHGEHSILGKKLINAVVYQDLNAFKFLTDGTYKFDENLLYLLADQVESDPEAEQFYAGRLKTLAEKSRGDSNNRLNAKRRNAKRRNDSELEAAIEEGDFEKFKRDFQIITFDEDDIFDLEEMAHRAEELNNQKIANLIWKEVDKITDDTPLILDSKSKRRKNMKFEKKLLNAKSKRKNFEKEETDFERLEGENKALKAKLNSLTDKKRLDARVKERIQVLNSAASLLNKSPEDLMNYSNNELKVQVIETVYPDIRTDGETKESISGMFNVATTEKSKGYVKLLDNALGGAGQFQGKELDKKIDLKDMEKKAFEDRKNSWKKSLTGPDKED